MALQRGEVVGVQAHRLLAHVGQLLGAAVAAADDLGVAHLVVLDRIDLVVLDALLVELGGDLGLEFVAGLGGGEGGGAGGSQCLKCGLAWNR